jgi:hypothetical protein
MVDDFVAVQVVRSVIPSGEIETVAHPSLPGDVGRLKEIELALSDLQIFSQTGARDPADEFCLASGDLDKVVHVFDFNGYPELDSMVRLLTLFVPFLKIVCPLGKIPFHCLRKPETWRL